MSNQGSVDPLAGDEGRGSKDDLPHPLACLLACCWSLMRVVSGPAVVLVLLPLSSPRGTWKFDRRVLG